MQEKNFYVFHVSGRGKVYYYQVRNPKTRKLSGIKSTGKTNKTLAEAYAQEEYEKLDRVNGSAQITLREWADRFYTDQCPHLNRLLDEGKKIKPYTIQQKRRYIEDYILDDSIAHIRLSDLRKSDLMDFRDRIIDQKGRTRTSQMIYGVLQTILLEAVTRGILESSPTEGIHKLGYDKKTRKALDITSIGKLLNPQYWDNLTAWRAAYIAALTGLRIGEVRALQWQDVDVENKRIIVQHNLTSHTTQPSLPKWGKVRVTIYPSRLSEMLEPLREGAGFVVGGAAPVGYKTIQKAMQDACRKAEVEATLHQLRHSLQTYLRGKGVADDLLRGVFGWSDTSTQEIYTHRELYDLEPIEKALPEL